MWWPKSVVPYYCTQMQVGCQNGLEKESLWFGKCYNYKGIMWNPKLVFALRLEHDIKHFCDV